MWISTKGRYAIRIMLDLAKNQKNEPVSLNDIAKRQGISSNYLEQIVSTLKKAGYVRSTRGAKGGYKMGKEPEEYTVGMILRLMEGSLAPVACLEMDNECEKSDDCVTVIIWRKIYDAVNEIIDGITIRDLLQWQEEKEGKI